MFYIQRQKQIMTLSNRVSVYEIKQVLQQIVDIVGYKDFTIRDLETKLDISPRRISSILIKASYRGLCKTVGTKEYLFISKSNKMYRSVNKYRIDKTRYHPKDNEKIHLDIIQRATNDNINMQSF